MLIFYYDNKNGLRPQECFKHLSSTFSESARSRSAVFNWFTGFERGRGSFKYEARTGRPPTAVTQENVQAFEKSMQRNRKITNVELEQELGIGLASMQTIIHDHLSLLMRRWRWVPYKLTDEQEDS
ncbi:Putative uncharacterized protein FLJ37770 [Eumeta japonica]|uniref:Mos1 transposase HTH domain-containing protein n=1 Tax=Eumeta variegata TaxID=151549 RepID=A0A4C1UBK5_EUMVA|nr:Putative uncharacterized protein FLJ37770 [Eumeta japonica]